MTHDVLLYISQNKYREEGRKTLSTCVYSQLAETTDTQFVKTVTELQSDVSKTHSQTSQIHNRTLSHFCVVCVSGEL